MTPVFTIFYCNNQRISVYEWPAIRYPTLRYRVPSRHAVPNEKYVKITSGLPGSGNKRGERSEVAVDMQSLQYTLYYRVKGASTGLGVL
jgi:hypothetical protein